ncbi:hypothetical protein CsSME_00009974 [Camellia sinensis var. sinensis]
MEEQRYNQHVQWEHQMANQVNSLGTQFDTFATAQNSLIQQFGEFRLDIERRHEVANNRIYMIEHRVNDKYHHYFPPPLPPYNDC